MTATLEAPRRESDDRSDGLDGAADEAPPQEPRPVPATLAPWHDPRPVVGWLVTLAVTVLAGFTRFWALGYPPGTNSVPKNGMNFDEVYYAVEAQEVLRYGYEDNRGYMFIVHPPLGKWLIAFGEYFVGGGDKSQYLTNSIGWRIAPALVGVLAVVILTRTVRRMMRSTLFGAIAGVLLSLEGLSLVLSRTAILDIFLQFFVLAGFAALVVDRDKVRARLAALILDGADLAAGAPSLGPRPWRVFAGVLLGLACAIKWSALSFYVIFALMSLVWDRAALKSAGVERSWITWWKRSVPPAIGSFLVVPVLTYLLCWIGWFTGENAWNRHWADTHKASGHISIFGLRVPFDWGWLPGPIRSLGAYHHDAYSFHENLDSPHAYQSNPWSWLVLGRPVDFYYNGAAKGCGASQCSREVLLIGTPLMWWAFAPMLLWLGWHWFTTRDWRAGSVWIAFIAGWVVWFQDLDRTMFLFYMAPLVPFLIIGLTLALGVMLGPAPSHPRRVVPAPAIFHRQGAEGTMSRVSVLPLRLYYWLRLPIATDTPAQHRAEVRRRWGVAGVTVFLALVVADFVWMWPMFTGGLQTYEVWHAHMWLPSWV